MSFRIWAVAFLTVIVGCGQTARTERRVRKQSTGTADDVIGIYRNQSNFDLVNRATAVDACRLLLDDPTKHDDLLAYKEGPWVAVPISDAEQFRQVLVDPDTFEFDAGKTCSPVFGVRLRFRRIDQVIDVNLCFECDILAVSQGDRFLGGEDFDFARHRLVKLCKSLFPNDSEIQQLDPAS